MFYVSVAIVFGLIAGWDFGAQYFAGYAVEKTLSVDKVFVFVVIMSTFAITVVASLLKSRRDPEARVHAGSLRDTREDRRTPATEWVPGFWSRGRLPLRRARAWRDRRIALLR